MNSARELWAKLESRLATASQSHIHELRSHLRNLTKGDSAATQYLQQIKAIVDALLVLVPRLKIQIWSLSLFMVRLLMLYNFDSDLQQLMNYMVCFLAKKSSWLIVRKTSLNHHLFMLSILLLVFFHFLHQTVTLRHLSLKLPLPSTIQVVERIALTIVAISIVQLQIL